MIPLEIRALSRYLESSKHGTLVFLKFAHDGGEGRDGEAVFESTTYQGVLWVQIHGLPPLNMTIATVT
ncbi:hypothetical protein GBA52_014888 [Prunus armeniaca]|nr:hypothetical protein GBA52_014888 [Prunus armeniaca]